MFVDYTNLHWTAVCPHLRVRRLGFSSCSTTCCQPHPRRACPVRGISRRAAAPCTSQSGVLPRPPRAPCGRPPGASARPLLGLGLGRAAVGRRRVPDARSTAARARRTGRGTGTDSRWSTCAAAAWSLCATSRASATRISGAPRSRRRPVVHCKDAANFATFLRLVGFKCFPFFILFFFYFHLFILYIYNCFLFHN